MFRVWLRCALTTAVVVGGVILLTGDGPPKPSPLLSERDVRMYNEVAPQIQRTLGDGAVAYEAARREGHVDAEGLGIHAAAKVDEILERHGLDREAWGRLSRRVEEAVQEAR